MLAQYKRVASAASDNTGVNSDEVRDMGEGHDKAALLRMGNECCARGSWKKNLVLRVGADLKAATPGEYSWE